MRFSQRTSWLRNFTPALFHSKLPEFFEIHEQVCGRLAATTDALHHRLAAWYSHVWSWLNVVFYWCGSIEDASKSVRWWISPLFWNDTLWYWCVGMRVCLPRQTFDEFVLNLKQVPNTICSRSITVDKLAGVQSTIQGKECRFLRRRDLAPSSS